MRLPLFLCYIKNLKLVILVYSSLLLFWCSAERTDVLATWDTRETELVSCRIGLWDHFKKRFWPRILRKPVIADKKSNSVFKTVPWCTSAQPRSSLTHNLNMTYLPTWRDLQFVSFLFLPSLSSFSLHWAALASFVHWPLSWTSYLLCACSAALWNVLEDVYLRGFCSAGSQTPSSG